MINQLDPQFVPTLRYVRDRVRMSPVAMGIVAGALSYWVRRSLLGDSRLHALVTSATLGATVASGLSASTAAHLDPNESTSLGEVNLIKQKK